MTSTIEAVPEEIYDIELEHSLLAANAKLAKENRTLLDQHGVTAFDFMGAIGSGKTTLICRLVERLKDELGIAVFNGDATIANGRDEIAARSPERVGAIGLLLHRESLVGTCAGR